MTVERASARVCVALCQGGVTFLALGLFVRPAGDVALALIDAVELMACTTQVGPNTYVSLRCISREDVFRKHSGEPPP